MYLYVNKSEICTKASNDLTPLPVNQSSDLPRESFSSSSLTDSSEHPFHPEVSAISDHLLYS